MIDNIQDAKLRQAVNALPQEIQPQHDLWPGIAGQITPRRGLTYYWPAAAAMVLVAVGAFIATVLLTRPVAHSSLIADLPSVQQQTTDVQMPATVRAQTLAAAVRRTTQLAPQTQAVLLKNLAIIENSLDNIQQALQRNPSNIGLQGLLYQMYRSEAALMSAAQRVQLQTTTGVLL